MAIAWANNGTAGLGTSGNTILRAYPTSLASGDLILLHVFCKYATRTINTPSGFTALGTTSGGAGTDGTADEGNVKIAVFYKISDGTESGTLSVTFTGGTGNMSCARMARFTRSAGTGWLVSGSAVDTLDAGGTTAVSFTYDTDPGFSANDLAIACSAFNTDTYSFSSHALSASGATFAAHATPEAMDTGHNEGSDGRQHMALFDCTAGPSSGVATFSTTASGSATNSPAGASVLVRLREDVASGTVIPLFMHNYRQRRSA